MATEDATPAKGTHVLASLLILLGVSPMAGPFFGRIAFDSAAGASLLSLVPIAIILVRLIGTQGKQGDAAAVACIVVGYPMTYVWVTHGGEHVMIWAIALLTYFAAGFATLLSLKG